MSANTSPFSAADFRVQIVRTEEEVAQCSAFFVDHFLPRDPVVVGLDVAVHEFEDQFRSSTEQLLRGGCSVCAIHAPSGELAGVMCNRVITKQNQGFSFQGVKLDADPGIKSLMTLYRHLEECVDLFEDPAVEKVLDKSMITVHPKYANNKLAYRLTKEGEKVGASMGCQLATSQSTNAITQHISLNMDYTLRYTLDLATFEVDEKQVVDASRLDGTKVAQVFTKYLKNT